MAENSGDNPRPSDLGNGVQESDEQRNKTRLFMAEDAIDGILRKARPYHAPGGREIVSMAGVPLAGGGHLVLDRIVHPPSEDTYAIHAEIPQSDDTRREVAYRWFSGGVSNYQSAVEKPMEFEDGRWRRTNSSAHVGFNGDDIEEIAELIYNARPPHEEFKGEGELPKGFDDESWQISVDLASNDPELAASAKDLVSGSENPNLYGDMIQYVTDKYRLSELEALAAVVLCRERVSSASPTAKRGH